MMGGCRMADSDATPQQNGHSQPAVAHVADLGDLIDDLADGVEDEVGEHEVDNRASAGHGGAAAEADEAAFADRRVAQANRAVKIIEAGRRLEVAAALADAFAHDEDRRVTRHFFGESLEGCLHVGDLASGVRQRTPSRFRCGLARRAAATRPALTHRRRNGRPCRVRARGWIRRIADASSTIESISVSMASSSAVGTACASTTEARRRAIGHRVFQPSTSSRVR